MIDLTQALGSAAHAATATRPTIAAAPVLARIRRRRAVRVAGQSAVGVAAAGGVAFAGIQLAERDATTPPATASPTVSATPTPTPNPEPSPPALVTAQGDFGCSMPVPMIVDPTGGTDVHLDLAASGVVLTEGAAVAVTLSLVNGTDQVAGPPLSNPQLFAAQDGVVVGLLQVPAPETGEPTLPPGATVTTTDTLTSGTCEGQALTGAPLSSGTYDLYATWPLGLTDVVVGGPWSLTVEPAAEAEGPEGPSDPHPALADLVVSTSGLGPLTIGLPPETNPGSAMIEFDAEYCASEFFEGDDPGRWVESGYADDPDRGDLSAPFRVAVDDTGRIGWIDVHSPGPRTAEGVGLGTPLTDLQATYPGLSGPFDGPVSRVWWLEDAAGILVFETQGDADGLQPPGTPDQVILMRVLLPGADPQFATANSAFVAGGC